MLQIVSTTLAALALAPALVHVLELPGKLRLGREGYLQVQTIYYPGFTIAGFAEFGALLVSFIQVLVTRSWLALAALFCFIAMQAIYWIVIQPINKEWLEHTRLGSSGAKFFAIGGSTSGSWSALRDRWEKAHAVRAALALTGFLMLLVAMKVS